MNKITLETKNHGTFTCNDYALTSVVVKFLPTSSAALTMELFDRTQIDYSDVDFAGRLIILAECEYGPNFRSNKGENNEA